MSEAKKITREELMEQVESVAYAMVHDHERGLELRDALEPALLAAKCKTVFESRLDNAVARLTFEAQKREIEEGGRMAIQLGGPNEALEDMCSVAYWVSVGNHAFAYGDLPVALISAQSSVARITLRDGKGNVIRGEDGKPMTEPAVTTISMPLDTHLSANVASAACGFFTRGNKPEPIAYPYAARSATAWLPHLKPLAGFANYPVWWDGDLLEGEGYHEGSRLMLSCPGIRIEEFTDPKEALDFLRDEWLSDFPFISEEDFLRALMVPMTILHAKTTLVDASGKPMFLANASCAGTGKTILCVVLSAAGTGTTPGSIPYSPLSKEEREKRIGAVLRESLPVLFLDNLATRSFLGHNDVTLTQVITSSKFGGRLLGSTKMFEVPCTSVILANGNNILVDGDMSRRVLEIGLQAKEGENLALREFKHPDIVRWTLDNRGRILGALRCIMQVKGSLKNVGGFPAWFNAVAAPLLIAADAEPKDILGSFIEASEEDVKGHVYPGGYEMMRDIASLKVPGVVTPLEGHWHFAGDIVEGFLREHKSLAKHGRGSPGAPEFFDERSLAFFLRGHKGVTAAGTDGAFRLYAEKRKNPKNSKTMWAFRVRTLPTPKMFSFSEAEFEDLGPDTEEA